MNTYLNVILSVFVYCLPFLVPSLLFSTWESIRVFLINNCQEVTRLEFIIHQTRIQGIEERLTDFSSLSFENVVGILCYICLYYNK